MKARRRNPLLCSGPGRLTEALGIRLEDDGAGFETSGFSLTLSTDAMPELKTGPRIGISKAQHLPWRFGLAGVTGLSRPFP